MKEPTLIIMAAGMGSRYGGLKQIDPVTEQGEIIMDFSLYDAVRAGFRKTVFVIKREMEKDFRELISKGAGRHMDIKYAFQELSDLPEGFSVPEGRIKPWGTSHAVMSCRKYIDGPFAVINADDYYGPEAFKSIYRFLSESEKRPDNEYCMIGYELRNTITENGYVSRGLCEISKQDLLEHIVERKKIMRIGKEICFSEDDGTTWEPVPEDTTVSMNFWGYTGKMMQELTDGFPAFLKKTLAEDPLKGEYLLPTLTDELIQEGKASVKVLPSGDRWYGVTYKEDKPAVVSSLKTLKEKGAYPKKLWK